MARSRPNSSHHHFSGAHSALLAAVAVTAAIGAFVPAPPAVAASLEKCVGKIDVEGDMLEGDLHANVSVMRKVVITGCDARIEAQLARFTKPGFDDSRWTLEGDVKIRMDSPQGSLSSDKAVVSFRDNRIDRVTITGKPAQFQQTRTDSKTTAYGRAGQIVYELGAGTVNLTDNAWVCDGSREMRSSKLQYDLGKQQLNASSGEAGQRVHLTIDPRASSNDPKKVTTEKSPAAPISCTPPAWSPGGATESAAADDKRPPAP
jgi:lipopolysaccharide transport protein LptA